MRTRTPSPAPLCSWRRHCSARQAAPGTTRRTTPTPLPPHRAPSNRSCGCGTGGWTDPSDLAPGRKPARCDKGTPAPQPLAKKRKITVATGTLSAEYVAPLQVAVAKGEFEKEGLDVSLKVLPTPDALPLLAKGDVDAQWAAPEAAVMNGINGGFAIKWVAGNFSPTRPRRAACGYGSRTARAPITWTWRGGSSAR